MNIERFWPAMQTRMRAIGDLSRAPWHADSYPREATSSQLVAASSVGA
ncbi:hypothetical protein [Streptomyces cadmiisoli]